MAATDVLSEILRLPPEDRARLALELIRSLNGEPDLDAAAAWPRSIVAGPKSKLVRQTR